jgi:hypothetical protein
VSFGAGGSPASATDGDESEGKAGNQVLHGLAFPE